MVRCCLAVQIPSKAKQWLRLHGCRATVSVAVPRKHDLFCTWLFQMGVLMVVTCCTQAAPHGLSSACFYSVVIVKDTCRKHLIALLQSFHVILRHGHCCHAIKSQQRSHLPLRGTQFL
jgi:hypothetical protein